MEWNPLRQTIVTLNPRLIVCKTMRKKTIFYNIILISGRNLCYLVWASLIGNISQRGKDILGSQRCPFDQDNLHEQWCYEQRYFGFQPYPLNRTIFVNNVMRIKSAVVSIVEFVQFIKSCLEWENPVRCSYIFASETSSDAPHFFPGRWSPLWCSWPSPGTLSRTWCRWASCWSSWSSTWWTPT